MVSAMLKPSNVSPNSVLSNLAFLKVWDEAPTPRKQAYDEKTSLQNDVTRYSSPLESLFHISPSETFLFDCSVTRLETLFVVSMSQS